MRAYINASIVPAKNIKVKKVIKPDLTLGKGHVTNNTFPLKRALELIELSIICDGV
jgi:hypothetical protein